MRPSAKAKQACAIVEQRRKLMLVIKMDAEYPVNSFEYEHCRERLSTSTTCHSQLRTHV